MPQQQPIQIATASENTLQARVTDTFGVGQDNTKVTVFATVTDRLGAVVVNQQAMTFTAIGTGTPAVTQDGTWRLLTQATAWVYGNGPWSVLYQVYDISGLAGTELRSRRCQATDTEQ